MKKIFVMFAIAVAFAACNNEGEKKGDLKDSTDNPPPPPAASSMSSDTTHHMSDTSHMGDPAHSHM